MTSSERNISASTDDTAAFLIDILDLQQDFQVAVGRREGSEPVRQWKLAGHQRLNLDQATIKQAQRRGKWPAARTQQLHFVHHQPAQVYAGFSCEGAFEHEPAARAHQATGGL